MNFKQPDPFYGAAKLGSFTAAVERRVIGTDLPIPSIEFTAMISTASFLPATELITGLTRDASTFDKTPLQPQA